MKKQRSYDWRLAQLVCARQNRASFMQVEQFAPCSDSKQVRRLLCPHVGHNSSSREVDGALPGSSCGLIGLHLYRMLKVPSCAPDKIGGSGFALGGGPELKAGTPCGCCAHCADPAMETRLMSATLSVRFIRLS